MCELGFCVVLAIAVCLVLVSVPRGTGDNITHFTVHPDDLNWSSGFEVAYMGWRKATRVDPYGFYTGDSLYKVVVPNGRAGQYCMRFAFHLMTHVKADSFIKACIVVDRPTRVRDDFICQNVTLNEATPEHTLYISQTHYLEEGDRLKHLIEMAGDLKGSVPRSSASLSPAMWLIPTKIAATGVPC